MSAASASRSRGRQRELRYAEHLEERYGGLARRFESGCFDVVWLRSGERPALLQMKSTLTAYSHFGPEDRVAALEQAEQAGADAVLVWWPKGSGVKDAVWVPSSEWP